MKKFLALLLVLVMTFALASCSLFSKPELDLDDAQDNLEDEDYTVYYVDDEDELEAGMVEGLSAYDEDDNFLYVVVFDSTKLAKIYYKEAKLELDAEIKAIKLEIQEIEYLLENYKKDLDDPSDYKDQLKDLEDELEELEEVVLGRSGKTVWRATKDAIDASKGK